MKKLLTAALCVVLSVGSMLATGPQRSRTALRPHAARTGQVTPQTPAGTDAPATRAVRSSILPRGVEGRQHNRLQDASAATAPKAPVMRVLGDGTTIYGSLIYTDEWLGQSARYGLYSFPASGSPEASFVKSFDGYEGNGGGAYGDGKYYFNSYVYTTEMGYTFSTFFTYDIATDTYSKVINSFISGDLDQTQITHDMTWDPTTGTLYAVSYIKVVIDEIIERYRPAISTVDTYTGMVTPIAETPVFIVIACNSAGELYGITKGVNSALYRINKSTGDCTFIGETGLNPEFVQSATFDPVTDKLYWAETQVNGTSGLYEVDVTSGRAAKIATFANSEEFAGIYIPVPEVADGAPATPENLEVDFAGASHSGKLRFTAPRLSMAGTALSGNISADVTLDGDEYVTLDVAPGQLVEVEVDLSEGIHNYGVTMSNSAGNGQRVARSFYVGMDAPAAVTDLTLSGDADGNPVLSWTAPATGRNDGFIDPAQITYTIERMPEGIVLASGIKATSFTDRSSFEAQNVSYTVTPYIGSRQGVSASTEEALFGSGSELPVTFSFSTPEEYALCTVIDANKDIDKQYHWGAWFYGPDFPAANVTDGCAVYGFSPEGPADDWIIMPPFTAENGRSYRVTFFARGTDKPETLTLHAGSSLDVNKMPVVSDDFSVTKNGGEMAEFSTTFRANASGNYYVAFHCTSVRKAGYLYLDDVTIDEVPQTGAPAAVSDMEVVPGEKGALTATINMTAPTLTAEGAALTQKLTKIEIYRGNERTAIHSFEKPAAGASLSWTDTDPVQGVNVYRAVAFNSVGQGEKALAQAYIGHDLPLAVTDLVLSDATGYPTLTWTAPTEGQNGGYIDTENLTYRIVRSDNTLMTNKARGTSFTDESLNPMAGQYFIYYQVEPVSPAGVGDYALSNHIVFGEPYEGPFSESFADASLSTDPWTLFRVKGSTQLWTLMSQGYSPYCSPADGDGGIAVFESTMGRTGDESRLVSPKLSLNGFDIPVLTFAFYHNPSYESLYGEDPYLDRMIPEVCLPDGSYVPLDEAIYVDDPTADAAWYLYEYDLSAYKDEEYVQLSFHGIADYENDVMIDMVSVTNEVEYDLGVYNFSGPSSVKAGNEIGFKITLANNGMNPAEGFKINILRDGQPLTFISSKSAVPSKSYATYSLRLPTTIEEDEGKTYVYTAQVEWDKDRIASNNIGGPVTVKVTSPDAPEVDEFYGSVTDNGVHLQWSGRNTVRVSDDFNSYESFAIDNIGDYTVYDGDGCQTYTFGQLYYPNSGEPMAWMVFDPYTLGVSQVLPEWAAHNGKQTLAAFCAYSVDGSSAVDVKADDWLISPRIHGASSVSFWAKTANPEWGFEKFEVLYSTTDKDPASFRSVDGVLEGPMEWTQFSYDLPLTARYFAIRNVSEGTFVLYVDDLCFKQYVDNSSMEHTGYRLYRDGLAIADLDPEAQSYVDTEHLTSGEHVYAIRALYGNKRESGAAETVVNVSTSGTELAAVATGVSVEGMDITVAAAQDASVKIVNAAGLTVHQGNGPARVTMSQRGVYLVSVDGEIFKVIL